MPVAEPILTLTGNLLCERTLELPAWAAGRTNRASAESFQVGGKGINVTKMLQRLGVPSTALAFAGGPTGLECAQWLRRQPFAHHLFRTDRATRIGVVVRSPGIPETTFFSPDTSPDPAAIRACVAYLDAQPRGQLLAVCGSLPGWKNPEFDPLRAALERWMSRGPLAVDTYGPPLAWFVTQPVTLVKINAVELRTLFPDEPPATSTAALLATAAQRWPVQDWIITDGAQPVWHAAAHQAPASVVPPVVQEASPTGSGDVLFACLLAGRFSDQKTLHDALVAALPYAAANAAHPGVADFPLPLPAA